MARLFPLILALMLLGCLASFGWAIIWFFVAPKKKTLGAKLTATTAFACAAIHFQAILSIRYVSVARDSMAVVIYALAAALFWWAVRVNLDKPLAMCWSEAQPLQLNTRGPYRFVGHPFYGSYLLACLGGPIATGAWSLLPTAILLFVIYRAAALREEEQFERSPFAGQYKIYRSRTGRFLPNVWKIVLRKVGTEMERGREGSSNTFTSD
jgi:protein-S-isoprenylcysteine O-methyltransferase Ste14